jgi:hypothetical protein
LRAENRRNLSIRPGNRNGPSSQWGERDELTRRRSRRKIKTILKL